MAGARLFSLVLEKLVQETAGAVLVWQAAGRLQAGCRQGAKLLQGWGQAPPRCWHLGHVLGWGMALLLTLLCPAVAS